MRKTVVGVQQVEQVELKTNKKIQARDSWAVPEDKGQGGGRLLSGVDRRSYTVHERIGVGGYWHQVSPNEAAVYRCMFPTSEILFRFL